MTLPKHPESDDPNEAYDIVPMKEEPRGPSGWWTVTCNGIPVRHFGPDKRDTAERYATDPELRRQIADGEVKLWKKGQPGPAS